MLAEAAGVTFSEERFQQTPGFLNPQHLPNNNMGRLFLPAEHSDVRLTL
jgi:hypothetical protein